MNLSNDVNFLLSLVSQIKILHWQTHIYAKHIAFDSTFSDLSSLMDSFVEVAMGIDGRFVLDDSTKKILILNIKEVTVENYINEAIGYLLSLNETYNDPKYSGLLNIRDEILSTLQKLNYLLTLK
jgi:hypothetical protein